MDFIPQVNKSVLKRRLTDSFQIQLVPAKCVKKQLTCLHSLYKKYQKQWIPELDITSQLVFEVHLLYPEIPLRRLAMSPQCPLMNLITRFVFVTRPHLTISLLKQSIWSSYTWAACSTTHFIPRKRIKCVPHSKAGRKPKIATHSEYKQAYRQIKSEVEKHIFFPFSTVYDQHITHSFKYASH